MSGPFLEAAARIGRRICRDAVWHGDACGWLGDSLEAVDGSWSVVHRALGPEVYSGSAGIAMLLAQLYWRTGEAVLRRTALAGLKASAGALAQLPPAAGCGLYSGRLGAALAMVQAGQAFGREEWIERAGRLALDAGGLHPDAGLDIVSGSAGAVVGLLDLARALPGHGLSAHALAHGERLAAAARRQDGRASWDTLPGQTRQDLTGFSHGVSGIAWALLELGKGCARPDLVAVAHQGFDYERACFDVDHGNWPDFRAAPPGAAASGAPVFGVAWCHGAPGIGLARLRAWQLSGDQRLRDEALAALQTTDAHVARTITTGYDCTPCHGHAGNLELMLIAAQVLGDPVWRDRAAGHMQRLLVAWQDGDWPCGVPGGGETPALLTGLSGIAWCLLRLDDPHGMPSLLLPGQWTWAAAPTPPALPAA